MSREFGRVYQDIFDSSLSANWKHMSVWMSLLALAGSSPFIRMGRKQIAHRIKHPPQLVNEAIDAFLAEDLDSRTKAFGGRRLVPLDSENENAGFRIVNWEKWLEDKKRESQEARRRYKTEKEREYRARKIQDPAKVNIITDNITVLPRKLK
jgi:hypothetical protein